MGKIFVSPIRVRRKAPRGKERPTDRGSAMVRETCRRKRTEHEQIETSPKSPMLVRHRRLSWAILGKDHRYQLLA